MRRGDRHRPSGGVRADQFYRHPQWRYAEAAIFSRTDGSGSVAKTEYTTPAIAAPMIGATQNSHNCSSAHPPTNIAGAVLRAGFTERFVTGIPIR